MIAPTLGNESDGGVKRSVRRIARTAALPCYIWGATHAPAPRDFLVNRVTYLTPARRWNVTMAQPAATFPQLNLNVIVGRDFSVRPVSIMTLALWDRA